MKPKPKPTSTPEGEAEAEAAEAAALMAKAYIRALVYGTSDQKETAAQAFCLGGELHCYAFCPSEVASPLPWLLDAIPPLVALLAAECSPKQKEHAASALYGLARNPSNVFNPRDQPIADRIVAVGGLRPLVCLVESECNEETKVAAAGALQCCAYSDAHRTAIVYAGGVRALLHLARDGTIRQKEVAVMALGFLCFKHSGARTAILTLGGADVLTSLAQQGSPLSHEAAYALQNLQATPAQHSTR
ncbi:hypothetical protein AB1Y20_000054 [Prymnesium parvum]|uniref:Armadillo repeat-containing protein 8 n=1 Tax=Prymnesium parvum TaxID=97485 RepID=A0AB34K3U9_PRYPA